LAAPNQTGRDKTGMWEYFSELETTRKYNGYFYSVGEALPIVKIDFHEKRISAYGVKTSFSCKKGISVKKEGIVYNDVSDIIAKENPVSPEPVGVRLQSVNGRINTIHFINKLNGIFFF
jgi:hypothetical protein